jgi:hypothetical protein
MENCFFYISRMYEFLHRLGQTRSFDDVCLMSDLPPKADSSRTSRHFTADRRSLGQREGICHAENVVGLGFGDDAWVEWLRLVSGTCRASRASRSRGSKGR